MTHENCIEIAVGEDRREVESLQELCKQPKWVVLKNIHLSSESLLTELEKRLKSLENVHEKFAVWMTAEPNEKIQHSFVVSCVKVAYEAPHGVKKNMRRAYDIWKNEHVVWKSLDEMRSAYALAWFHSIVLERRTYIPQGWSQYYEFNDSDLTATLKVLQKSIHSGMCVDYNILIKLFIYIRYLFCGIDDEIDIIEVSLFYFNNVELQLF